MYIREIRVSYVDGKRVGQTTKPAEIKTARDAVALMAPLLEPEAVEVCYLLCLTTKLGLIGYHELSRGCLDQAPIHPREVFKVAILANAAGIILLHNHPSGDPFPSGDDAALTGRLKAAGELIGIEVVDHIVVGHQGRYVSFKEQGRL